MSFFSPGAELEAPVLSETLQQAYTLGGAGGGTILYTSSGGGLLLKDASVSIAASLLKVQNNGGTVAFLNILPNSSQILRTGVSTAIGAIGSLIDTSSSWTTATAQGGGTIQEADILQIQNNGTAKFAFAADGYLSATNAAATSGAQQKRGGYFSSRSQYWDGSASQILDWQLSGVPTDNAGSGYWEFSQLAGGTSGSRAQLQYQNVTIGALSVTGVHLYGSGSRDLNLRPLAGTSTVGIHLNFDSSGSTMGQALGGEIVCYDGEVASWGWRTATTNFFGRYENRPSGATIYLSKPELQFGPTSNGVIAGPVLVMNSVKGVFLPLGSFTTGDPTPYPAAVGPGIATVFNTGTDQGYIFSYNYNTSASKVLNLNTPGGAVNIASAAARTTVGGPLTVTEALSLARATSAGSPTVAIATTIEGITDTSSARTVTLYAASAVPIGTILIIKDESGGAATHNITINRAGADTIDGATSATISANYGVVRLYSDGTSKWFSI